MRLKLLVFLGLSAFLLACGDDPPPDPTLTPEPPTRAIQVQPTSPPRPVPTPQPTAASQPPSTPGIDIVDAYRGDTVPFPENTMLLIETGCTSCDGPPSGLVRVYRNQGEVHWEKIFEAPTITIAGAEPYITSLTITRDVSEIVAVVCTREYCGGLGFARPGAEATFYRSTDVGATWTPMEVSTRFLHVLGYTDRGPVKAHWGEPPAFSVGNTALPTPEDQDMAPLTTGDGKLYWRRRTQVLFEDGRVRIDLPHADYLVDVIERDPPHAPLVLWSSRRSGDIPGMQFVTTVGADGTQYGYRLPGFLQIESWLDYRTLVVVVDDPVRQIGMVPGLMDWGTGQISAISDYPDELRGGRNTVRAVVRGPFLRVAIAGCVNFRDGPSQASNIVGCVANNALVKDIDGTGGGPGRWVRVRLFDGRIGYIAGEYLTE